MTKCVIIERICNWVRFKLEMENVCKGYNFESLDNLIKNCEQTSSESLSVIEEFEKNFLREIAKQVKKEFSPITEQNMQSANIAFVKKFTTALSNFVFEKLEKMAENKHYDFSVYTKNREYTGKVNSEKYLGLTDELEYSRWCAYYEKTEKGYLVKTILCNRENENFTLLIEKEDDGYYLRVYENSEKLIASKYIKFLLELTGAAVNSQRKCFESKLYSAGCLDKTLNSFLPFLVIANNYEILK